MTVTSANSHSSAHAYLQSLLYAGGTAAPSSGNPLTSLMNSFYPNSPTGDASVAPSAPPPLASGSAMSPGSMSALLDTQEQSSRTSHAQQLFAKMDADGDGKISQSEFENVFGAGADAAKVDGLFNALDGDSDGKVSGGEFMAAVQNAQQAHGHRHHRRDHGEGEGDPLQQLLNGTGANGATAQKTTAPDGSTTTTIKYADGSSVSMTTPAASSSGGQASMSGGNTAEMNALEQLIKMQAQFVSRLTAPANALVATV